MKTLAIFADYGLDDAAATISIFNHSDAFDAIDIIPIGGNVPVEVSYRNCYTLLACYPALWDKVRVVSTCHMPQPGEQLFDIHGKDGMGNLLTPPQEKPQVRELRYEQWLQDYTGEEIVLSLGPMTLVRPVVEKHPCKQLIIMGGRIHAAPNFNGYEFNHALDVAAFNDCVRFPHVAITLDASLCPRLDITGDDLSGDELHVRALHAYRALGLARNEVGCYVWDDIAACYLLHPERFEVRQEVDQEGNLLSHALYRSALPYYAD